MFYNVRTFHVSEVAQKKNKDLFVDDCDICIVV